MMRSLLLCLMLVLPLGAAAVIDVYEFETAEQEQRFRALTQELRCPKCQNQSIADSDADIAGDMRARTALMLREGHSDREVVDYFRARYGDFVSYRPPVALNTALLWFSPLLILLIGGVLVVRALRRANRAPLEDDNEETH
ncbi:cytochrome c-type biogenesis protein [Isoalcanivorax beigongshangi]|uniref:Cytochrome c-type biogenesis protein n=1 Tax=Isoalcanivorax beigongshangi TaxID=3238810 RepID=A0ABV4AFG6_9GAMM